MALPQDRVIHIHCSDPDATDSDSDSNTDSLERFQHKRFSKTIVIPQSIPNQNQSQNQNPNQNSSKYKGVTLKESGKWGAQIRDPIRRRRVWLGVFPSEEEAHQAYQAAYDRIEKEKAQIDQEAAITQCQLCQAAGQQCQLCQKANGGVNPQSIPSQNQNQNQKKNQNSSKYKGVTLRESGKWAAQIWDCGVRVWLGTFPSEEEAHQAYQAAHDRIKKEKSQIAQGKKTQLYQKGEERREGVAAIQIKKEEEKAEKEVTTAVVSPPVKKRKRTKKGEEKEVTTAVVSTPVKKRRRTVSRPPVQPQSFVSKEKQRNDIPSDNPTSGADIRTGSTSPVHNTSARPPGLMEDLSSQLLKQKEALTDAVLKTGDFDSENDLIQVDHLSTWAGNLSWDVNLLFKK